MFSGYFGRGFSPVIPLLRTPLTPEAEIILKIQPLKLKAQLTVNKMIATLKILDYVCQLNYLSLSLAFQWSATCIEQMRTELCRCLMLT